MKKRIAAITLCFVAILSLAMPMSIHAGAGLRSAYEVAIEDFAPLWVNTARISVSLSITNGRAVMGGIVTGNTGTESITVNALLERANPNGTFTYIVSFNNLRANGNFWAWERPHMVARGHNYRLTLTATVVRGGVSEVVSLSRITWAN